MQLLITMMMIMKERNDNDNEDNEKENCTDSNEISLNSNITDNYLAPSLNTNLIIRSRNSDL